MSNLLATQNGGVGGGGGVAIGSECGGLALFNDRDILDIYA